MFFLVIERFRQADPDPVRRRFEQFGRMMPDGLKYHSSWMDVTGSRCFQLVETDEPALLDQYRAP